MTSLYVLEALHRNDGCEIVVEVVDGAPTFGMEFEKLNGEAKWRVIGFSSGSTMNIKKVALRVSLVSGSGWPEKSDMLKEKKKGN